MSENARKSDGIATIDSTLTALALTAFCYAGAFSYARGYLGHFGVPSSLTSIDIKDFLIFGGSAGGGAVLFYNAANLFVKLWPTGSPVAVQRAVTACLLYIGLPLGFVAYLGEISSFPWYLLFWGGFIVFLEFIFPLIAFRNVAGYVSKLEACHGHDRSSPDLTDHLGKRLGRRAMLWSALSVLMLVFAHATGIRNASRQEWFLATEQVPAQIIVGTFEGSLLAVSIDPVKKRTLDQISIVPVGSGVMLGNRKAGPLASVERNGKSEELRATAVIRATPSS